MSTGIIKQIQRHLPVLSGKHGPVTNRLKSLPHAHVACMHSAARRAILRGCCYCCCVCSWPIQRHWQARGYYCVAVGPCRPVEVAPTTTCSWRQSRRIAVILALLTIYVIGKMPIMSKLLCIRHNIEQQMMKEAYDGTNRVETIVKKPKACEKQRKYSSQMPPYSCAYNT